MGKDYDELHCIDCCVNSHSGIAIYTLGAYKRKKQRTSQLSEDGSETSVKPEEQIQLIFIPGIMPGISDYVAVNETSLFLIEITNKPCVICYILC